MLKIIGPAMKSGLPPARQQVLTGELKKNDPHFLRRQTHVYLAYLDHDGSLAQRFCDSGTRAWVVFGERDDVEITTDERELLEALPGALPSRPRVSVRIQLAHGWWRWTRREAHRSADRAAGPRLVR